VAERLPELPGGIIAGAGVLPGALAGRLPRELTSHGERDADGVVTLDGVPEHLDQTRDPPASWRGSGHAGGATDDDVGHGAEGGEVRLDGGPIGRRHIAELDEAATRASSPNRVNH
jgi:hypothetical protein